MLPEDLSLYEPLKDRPAKCLGELDMLKMSQEIRKKPNWFEKVHDKEIAAKWKAEGEGQGVLPEGADYVIEEVKYFSTLREGSIEPGPVDGTWIADKIIPEETVKTFKSLVANGLENVSSEQKDFHPGSDDLLLDLVHPSLFCYVEDESNLVNKKTVDVKFLPKSSPSPPKKVSTWYTSAIPPSDKYRWMPAEISFDTNGSVSFDSYINNLHPIKHKELYSTIGEIFKKFVPLFNKTLTDVANDRFCYRIDLSRWPQYDPDINFDYDAYEGREDVDVDEEHAKWEKAREILPLPIQPFKKPAAPAKVIDLNGEKLQVIVKLANIELTPEKPRYGGGAWHIEGIAEERIVATGIYYYEVTNITESKLHFRQSIQDPLYDQNDDEAVFKIYGMKNEEAMNQILGNIVAREDLCIVFPNTYQHRVAPFELVDKSKPGYRKILVFFLVDPTTKIISTNNVLPQQPDWDDVALDKPRNKMTREQAEKFREKLMFERKYARDTFEKEFYEREFSLCEH